MPVALPQAPGGRALRPALPVAAGHHAWGPSSGVARSQPPSRRNAPALCVASTPQAGGPAVTAAPSASAAATAAGPAPADAQAAFAQLAAQHLDTCSVELRACDDGGLRRGNGLFLSAAASRGDVLLSVPATLCLTVDYGSGLRLPPGAWPRLQRGVQKDDSLPWDVLLALALLDSLSGAGDAFWERYSNAVLPSPLDVTLPACMPPQLLAELQHEAVAAAAQQQQERLAALFPGLSGAMCEGGPSWLQWAFGCVRSRAFKLADECFAFVPFLDVANHGADPSCDFRLNERDGTVDLVAVRDLSAGQEATISYTGPEGATNQRFMAQYGFVPGGNPGDRLQFAALQPTAAAAATEPPALLSLDRMQRCLGSGDRMAAALSGRDPFAYAALKSLPFADDEAAASDGSRQVSLAERLLAELTAEAVAWPSSLVADSALVQHWRAAGDGGCDARLLAAVEYRLQRKALVATCRQLLCQFIEGPPAGAD